MSNIFHVDFYAKEWLLDTQILTLEERGVFIQVVAAIYDRQKPIPHNEKWLSNLCGCSVRKVRSILGSLVEQDFIQIVDGFIHQKRAEKELEKARKRSENASKNARKLNEKTLKNNQN